MAGQSNSAHLVPSRRAVSTPHTSSAADLAALEAHFLASFAGADFDSDWKQEVRNGKRKQVTAVGDDVHEAKQSTVKRLSGRQITRQEPRPVVGAQGGSTSTVRRAPVTIVFDEKGLVSSGPGQTLQGGTDPQARKNWKDFMNPKTSNTGPDAFSSASEFIRERNAAKQQKKREAEEATGDDDGSEDEAAQVTNDRQLSQLLNTTLFTPGSSSSNKKTKPDLSSHDTLSRILELSSSSQARKGQVFGRGHGDKALKASQLKGIPAKMRQGIRSAAGDRAEKEVQRNKEMGLLSDAYSRKIMGRQYEDETMTGKKREKNDRVRGLSMGVGKFKGGILKLSKEEVDKMTGEGRETSRGGSSKGGRGGRRGGGQRGGRGGGRGGDNKKRKMG